MLISVAIATYNEEKNIGRCLKAVRGWVDEIIVVDGSSDDRTREIAKELGAKVIKTTNKPNFHINKQMAIDKCQSDWFLQLDADEIVTPGLKEEILAALEEDPVVDGFKIPRKNYFLGRWLAKGGQYPDYVTRLFRKGKGKLPCASVHEKMKITSGKVGRLESALDHHPYPSFAEYLHKFNRYTELTAQNFAKENKAANLLQYIKLEFKAAGDFLNRYIRHKGFMDGFPGLMFALFSSLHPIVAYIKYWEIKHATSKK